MMMFTQFICNGFKIGTKKYNFMKKKLLFFDFFCNFAKNKMTKKFFYAIITLEGEKIASLCFGLILFSLS